MINSIIKIYHFQKNGLLGEELLNTPIFEDGAPWMDMVYSNIHDFF